MTTDKIKFDPRIISALFDEPVRLIVDQLTAIVARYNHISHIVMVGGFSESEMLQDAVKNAFPGKHMSIPQDAGLAVMKGAVIFCQNKNLIVSRIARFTYGIGSIRTYNSSVHHADKFIQQGIDARVVDSCFTKLVEIGPSITSDEAAGSVLCYSWGDETYYNAIVYATKAKNPVFIYDDGCFQIGSFQVNCKDKNGKISATELKLYFGRTEIEVKAI
ncbi:hypothetical protein DPMN_056838 [Dreissena polymorpha]|uniref:Uncharacterized protein n=1 Tax=Dreissena polymorpha TaxID=45954 RepID=A0A9D4HTZ4_DREPO|nr:hypothetical protein DPMN_056838 [Dreissena polymorpha]